MPFTVTTAKKPETTPPPILWTPSVQSRPTR